MKFILTLLIIILLIGYMLPLILRLWLKRVQKRFGMDANSGRDRPQRPSGSVHLRADRPKKRIDKQAGEYVDFEEIDKV